jgi:hypothetical protein
MAKKWNFYVKVLVVEDEDDELRTEQLSRDITRQIEKIYGVRSAEVTNITSE